MNIYEIDREIERILSQVDENGELPEGAFEELTALNESREEKIENAACMVINLAADAKAIKEQEAALKARREAVEKRVESIKRYLEYATDGSAFSSPRVQVKYSKSQAVEINDVEFWGSNPSPAFVRTKAEPDKTAIKAALKAGEAVPGASLVDRNTINVK